MAEQFMVSTGGAGRSGGNGKLIVICAAVGLLVGAGVVTPFAMNYRSSMQRAQQEAVVAATLAERNKQEAIALEKQKGELRENLGAAEKTVATLKDDLATRQAALETLRQSDTQKTKEVETLRADIQKQGAAMAELDGRLQGARAEVEQSTQQSAELATRVNTLRTEVSRMSETIQTQGVEITRLVEAVKTEAQAKQVAIAEATEQRARAEAAQVQVQATHAELMTLAPVRIEERRSTQTGQKIAEKSGFPFGAVFDGFGDLFRGVGEATLGKSGPVILVAVYKDGHEETLTTSDVDRWKERGIRVVKVKA